MTAVLTRPDGLTLEEWSAFLRDDLRSLEVTVYDNGESWKAWADRVASMVPELGAAPLSTGFDSWQDWANAIIGAAGR